LKLLKFFNGVAQTFLAHKHMGVGRGAGRNLKISAKNAVF